MNISDVSTETPLPKPSHPQGHGRKVRASVILLLAMHGGLLAYSATRHSPTLNEPGHLLAGLSYWKFARFDLYRVNPPLVKLIAALPVMAVGYDADWRRFEDAPGARPIFPMSHDFIAANQERSLWLMTIARWACIPFSLLGGLFCFLWSREFWKSQAAGLVSLTLWCFEPNVLAHGELVTPDCAATSFGLGATWLFWRWLKQPLWERAFAAGALLGLAQLSKMTWIILFGLWPLLWMVWCMPGRHRAQTTFRVWRQQTSQLASILLTGLYLLNLGYGFEGTGTPLNDFRFISSTLTGLEESGTVGNRFADTGLGSVLMPVPKQYLLGIDVQRYDFEDCGQRSFLNGEWKDEGWWYYYLYGLGVKTPHGTQCLLLASALVMGIHLFSRSVRILRMKPEAAEAIHQDAANSLVPSPFHSRDLLILLTPAAVVLVLASSQTGLNHHVRYALPTFGLAFVLAGVAGRLFERLPCRDHVTRRLFRLRAARCGVAAALVWTVASTLSVYPHQLAYFNELFGGPENGYRHLAHSNVDWGQDLLLAGEWMERNNIGRDDVRFESYYPYPAAGIIGPEQPLQREAPHVEIVSSNLVTQEDKPWIARLQAVSTKRIGYSLWVFPVDFPEERDPQHIEP